MAIHIINAVTTQIPAAAGIQIVINTTFAGTITVSDTAGTQAVVTNPTVGTSLPYFGSTGNFTIVTTGTGDASINILSRNTL